MNPTQATDQPPTSWALLCARLCFAFKHHRWPIVLAGLFLLILAIDWLSGWQFLDDIKSRWNSDLDQLVSLATLMTALFVWYGEMTQDWQAGLPKRLTVSFQNEQGLLLMRCDKAHLLDVSDIRALGQQIGSQICNVTKLSLRIPIVEQTSPTIKKDAEIGLFLHYQVTFTLTELPDALSGLPPRKHKLWQAPFSLGNITEEDNTP